jgi:hypothetical protein
MQHTSNSSLPSTIPLNSPIFLKPKNQRPKTQNPLSLTIYVKREKSISRPFACNKKRNVRVVAGREAAKEAGEKRRVVGERLLIR